MYIKSASGSCCTKASTVSIRSLQCQSKTPLPVPKKISYYNEIVNREGYSFMYVDHIKHNQSSGTEFILLFFLPMLLVRSQLSDCHSRIRYDKLPWRHLPVSCSNFTCQKTLHARFHINWYNIHTREGLVVVEHPRLWTRWCTALQCPGQPWECTAGTNV